jgi:hypothetical protein
MKNPLRHAEELFGEEVNSDFIDLGFDLTFEQRIDEFLKEYGKNMPFEKNRARDYIECREVLEVLQENDSLGVYKIMEKIGVSKISFGLDGNLLSNLLLSLRNDEYVTYVRDQIGYYGYKITDKGKEFLKLF